MPPVIAAALVLLFVQANEHIERKTNKAAVAVVLIAAARSSEAGTLLVLVHAGLITARLLWRNPVRQAGKTVLLYWLPPIAATLLVLWLLHSQRLGDAMLPNGNPALFHHSLASLRAAMRRFLPEVVASDGATFDARHIGMGILAKLAFYLGVQACWASADPAVRRTRSWLPPLALSLAVTSLGMLASSFRQFGGLCCEQHAFLRQSIGVVTLAALAILAPPLSTMVLRWRPTLAPASLSLAAALLLAPRAGDLWRDYRHFSEPAPPRS